MSLLATALGLSLLGSLGGLLVASLLLAFNESVRTRLVPWLISYAVGALLGASLLGLLPEALAEISPQAVLGSLLAGVAQAPVGGIEGQAVVGGEPSTVEHKVDRGRRLIDGEME